jgi:tripartite-type tricarboxylate transporter receptor subunit TctC
MRLNSDKNAGAFRRVLGCMLMAGLVAASIVAPSQVCANGWPSRWITMVVPYGAGGHTDIMARLLAGQLTKSLGVNVIVENKPGAGGVIATSFVSRANPDGYTLLFASVAQISIAPRIQASVDYQPLKSFVPVSLLGTNPHILAVNASLPVNNIDEFVAYAKAHPGEINYGSGGRGALAQLAAALFAARNNLQLTHVPYKGGAETMTALMAGQIQMYLGSSSEIMTALPGGKIKALAVSTKGRFKSLPNLPPIADVSPEYEITSWNGLFVPAGTPQDIVDRLERAAADAARDPGIAERLNNLGITPVGNTSAEFKTVIEIEQSLYDQAVKAAGLTKE